MMVSKLDDPTSQSTHEATERRLVLWSDVVAMFFEKLSGGRDRAHSAEMFCVKR
jgi:hypothetical protein